MQTPTGAIPSEKNLMELGLVAFLNTGVCHFLSLPTYKNIPTMTNSRYLAGFLYKFHKTPL
jgi:hypothetical protein